MSFSGLAHRYVDLFQTNRTPSPGIKKQLLISGFDECTWSEPFRIGNWRTGAEQGDLEIAISAARRMGGHTDEQAQQ